jgi:hypothetical protein
LSVCPRPLDPVDVEALASGAEPLIDPDARAHASECPACGQIVRRAESLERLLADVEGRVSLSPAPPDLADRVLRIRPFSRTERSSLAVWRAPLLLLGGLTVSGAGLVAGPLAGAREQVGLAAAFLASSAGLLRASLRWLLDLSRSAPAGLEALSELLAPTSVGWAVLLLLLPAGLALRTVLARAFARR